MEFKRYNKYLVLKWSDIEKYLTIQEQGMLDKMRLAIAAERETDGKTEHDYVVINEKMPYAEQVWRLIQEHWEVSNETLSTHR